MKRISDYFQNFPWFFFLRIARLEIFLVLVTVLSTFLVGRYYIKNYYSEQVQEQIKEQLLYIEKTFASDTYLGDWCFAHQNSKTRYTLISLNGDVVCDSKVVDRSLGNHATRPEVLEAISKKYGFAMRFSDTLKQTMYYGAIYLRREKLIVRMSFPVNYLFRALKNYDASTFAILVPLVFIFTILGSLVGFYISRPLRFILEKLKGLEKDILPFDTNLKLMYEKDEWAQIATIIDKAKEDLEDFSHGSESIDKRLVDQMRVDFVANISHELRTPITSIKGFAQLLKSQDHKISPELHPYVDKILGSANRLIQMFEDLLKLSLIESTVTLDKEKVELEPLFNRVIDEVAQKHTGKKLNKYMKFPPVDLMVEKNLFHQAIFNIVDNAFKYTKGDQVEINISAQIKEQGMLITLSDQGRGIPEQEVNRVFERFYRVDKSRTNSSIKGTGIGLSLVKHIILKHNGKIWVESAVGEGTVFYVWLPL